jgi:hypothetical protein
MVLTTGIAHTTTCMNLHMLLLQQPPHRQMHYYVHILYNRSFRVILYC